jgi:hypothetical protein
MDSQSSVKPLFNTEAGVYDTGAKGFVRQQLPQYTMCAALGLLAGAMGVALTIGLAILVNLLLPPSTLFAPGTIPLMVTGALAGVGFGWLLGRAANFTWPGLFEAPREKGLQVILVFSVLASLLQTLLFFAPL